MNLTHEVPEMCFETDPTFYDAKSPLVLLRKVVEKVVLKVVVKLVEKGNESRWTLRLCTNSIQFKLILTCCSMRTRSL